MASFRDDSVPIRDLTAPSLRVLHRSGARSARAALVARERWPSGARGTDSRVATLSSQSSRPKTEHHTSGKHSFGERERERDVPAATHTRPATQYRESCVFHARHALSSRFFNALSPTCCGDAMERCCEKSRVRPRRLRTREIQHTIRTRDALGLLRRLEAVRRPHASPARQRFFFVCLFLFRKVLKVGKRNTGGDEVDEKCRYAKWKAHPTAPKFGWKERVDPLSVRGSLEGVRSSACCTADRRHVDERA